MHADMDCRAFFNSLADGWDAKCAPNSELLTAVAFLSGARSGLSVLDIACGTGVMFPALLNQGIERLVGIDIADKMAAIAREKFAHDPRVEVRCGDFYAMEDGPFHAALLYNAYPHFLDKEGLIAKVASLLLPGGRFTMAHGMGRDALNAQHSDVPESVCTSLLPANEEAQRWKPWFNVDMLCDSPDFYLLSGIKR